MAEVNNLKKAIDVLPTWQDSEQLETKSKKLKKKKQKQQTLEQRNRDLLISACGYGQKQLVEEILQAGLKLTPELKDSRQTVLHEACQGGHLDVLCLLLQHIENDIDDYMDIKGRTALHIAAYNGEIDCLIALEEKRSKLNAKDIKGVEPIHLAAEHNHKEIIQYLYKREISLDCLDIEGKTPMHYACRYGSLDSLVCLIERDCDITLSDNDGFLPIHTAARYNHLDCLRLLSKVGCQIESVTLKRKRTCLHLAAFSNALNVVHWLCEKKCNIVIGDKYGNTPLHLAAEQKHPKSFNCLIRHGANLESKNNRNETPLESAKRSGCLLMMKKSIDNLITCPPCFSHYRLSKWEKENPLPKVILKINKLLDDGELFKLNVTNFQNNVNIQERKKRNSLQEHYLPKRDLPTQFYGLHLSENEQQTDLRPKTSNSRTKLLDVALSK